LTERRPQPSIEDLIQKALERVVTAGTHLSTAIDDVFAILRPSERLATDVRAALFAALRTRRQPDASGIQAPYHVFPAWLRSRLSDDHMQALLTDAPVSLRTNTLKTDRDSLLSALSPHEARPIAGSAVALTVQRPFGLFRTEAYRKGLFEQQDYSSQRVVPALAVEPGMRVVDACAGNGGKTLHLAAEMHNKGRIIALDPHEHKLAALRSRAARAGVTIVEPRVITSTKVVKRLADSADRVLIDAPCTGTGVIRRNPDILWHMTEEVLFDLLALQRDILRRNAAIVRAGGRLVYATCSLLPEEGEEQIRRFLGETREFSLAEESRTDVTTTSDDGFYIAVLTRSGSA
jgi:16S rRNA (cytosine967-C5)-methyltransferase